MIPPRGLAEIAHKDYHTLDTSDSTQTSKLAGSKAAPWRPASLHFMRGRRSKHLSQRAGAGDRWPAPWRGSNSLASLRAHALPGIKVDRQPTAEWGSSRISAATSPPGLGCVITLCGGRRRAVITAIKCIGANLSNFSRIADRESSSRNIGGSGAICRRGRRPSDFGSGSTSGEWRRVSARPLFLT